MTVGFIIKDASGNVTLDSTETTALLQDQLEITSTGVGSQTFTSVTNRNSYAVGLCESSANVAAGTWTGIDFNIANTISSTHPKVDWNIICDPISGLGACSGWSKYHIFVFVK